MTINDLLNLYPVRYITFMTDASTQESRASVMSTTASNDHDRKLVSTIFEISLVDIAHYHWYDPLFALETGVKVSDQEVIPHHFTVPRGVLSDILSGTFGSGSAFFQGRLTGLLSGEEKRIG